MAVSYVDRQVLAALATSVKEALHINHAQYGLLQSAFPFAYLIGAPLSGLMVDRIGPRRGLVLAVLFWSVVAAGHAFAMSFAVLFTLRVALGAAESPSFPGAAQVVRRVLPLRDRSAGFGLLFTGSSLGAMVAVPLAISLKGRFGDFRAAFVGTALVGLLWIPLFLFATYPKAVRAALAPHPATADASAERAASRTLSLGLLVRDPAVQRALLLTAGAAPAILFVQVWAPQYLQRAFALKEDQIGQYLWFPPVLFDMGAVCFGALASRRAHAAREADDAPIRSYADLLIVGALLEATLAFAPLASSPFWATVICAVCLAGGGAVFARLTADMLARVSPRHISAAGGLTAAAQSLAQIVANPIIGKVVDRTHSYSGTMVVLGLVVLPAALAWALWPMPGQRA